MKRRLKVVLYAFLGPSQFLIFLIAAAFTLDVSAEAHVYATVFGRRRQLLGLLVSGRRRVLLLVSAVSAEHPLAYYFHRKTVVPRKYWDLHHQYGDFL